MKWMSSLFILVKSLLVTVYFFAHTLVLSVLVILTSPFFSTLSFVDRVAGRWWPRPILRMGGIRAEVRGLENWPPENPHGILVLFNHTSWMDIPILYASLPQVPRFGAKEELYRIPFFGKALRRAGGLPISRGNRSKTLQIYKDAEARTPGQVFALAPEGTRQDDLNLGRFKQGPFLFAIGAQMTLVPVVIAGAREVMPKSSWLINARHWTQKVFVEILPAISTVGADDEAISRLQDQVRRSMEPRYRELNQELGLLK